MGGSFHERHWNSVDKEARNLGLPGGTGVTNKFAASANAIRDLVEHLDVNVTGLLCASIRAGTFLLLTHELAELCLVNRKSLLTRHFEGEVDRESVGVVKRESGLARQGCNTARRLLLSLATCHVKDCGSCIQRASEGNLFTIRDVGDRVPVGQ